MPSLPKEIWKAIPGYDGQYEASNLGRIRSLDRYIKKRNRYGLQSFFCQRGKILAGSKNRGGYVQVRLCGKVYRVHSLVVLTFKGPRPTGKQVNHKDGIKLNNRLCNLEYVTPSQDACHARDNGLRVPLRGKKHWKHNRQ